MAEIRPEEISAILREQLAQLAKCRFMHMNEFTEGVDALKGKKMVIIGCGAQGLTKV